MLSKENITLGLAAFAAVLAVAPYVIPGVRHYFVRSVLDAHPEEIVRASEAIAAKQQTAQADALRNAVRANRTALMSGNDPIIGNPAAPISVVVFEDYHCGYCKVAAPEIEALAKANPKVRFIIKEYPILSPQSKVLAAMALSTDSAHYLALHRALYENTVDTEQSLNAAIHLAGLDPAGASAAAKSQAATARVEATLLLGRKLGVTGTPTFIIGDDVVTGANLQAVKEKIAAAQTASS